MSGNLHLLLEMMVLTSHGHRMENASLLYDIPKTKGRIHVLEIATGKVKKLTNNDGLIADPRWSPDGKTIVYRYEGKEGNGIYTMSANGKNQKPLIPPKDGPILRFSPAWSSRR